MAKRKLISTILNGIIFIGFLPLPILLSSCSKNDQPTTKVVISLRAGEHGIVVAGKEKVEVEKGKSFGEIKTELINYVKAEQGYLFDQWVNNSGEKISDGFVISQDFSIKAIFKVDAPSSKLTINISTDEHGSIVDDKNKIEVDKGEIFAKVRSQLAKCVKANEGYELYKWANNDGSIIADNFIINSDFNVRALFKEPTPSSEFDFSNFDKIHHTVTISKYSGTNTTIIIPGSFTKDGVSYTITSIGYDAFFQHKNIVSITVPETVTSIGNAAFASCNSLSSINIPDSVTSIGEYAFYECFNLTHIIIPDAVETIGQFFCSGCRSLLSVSMPSSLKTIGYSAFASCRSLTSIDLPNGLTSIENNAFEYCLNLSSIVIPDSVTFIGKEVFNRCSALSSAKFSNQLTSISANFFAHCTSLTSIIIPDSVKHIDSSAFSWCTSLTSIIIPDSVESIGESAFNNCKNLCWVIISKNIVNIGSMAFAYCSKITNFSDPYGRYGFKFNGTVDAWKKCRRGWDWHSDSRADKIECLNNEVCGLDEQ